MSIRGYPNCHFTPVPLDSILNDICLPRRRNGICVVYVSIVVLVEAIDCVVVPVFEPPSDSGSLNPAPELFSGFSVNVAEGPPSVDPSNVISGNIRHTNANWWPSCRSNSADVIDATTAAGGLVIYTIFMVNKVFSASSRYGVVTNS